MKQRQHYQLILKLILLATFYSFNDEVSVKCIVCFVLNCKTNKLRPITASLTTIAKTHKAKI
jgi:hypothetical protein